MFKRIVAPLLAILFFASLFGTLVGCNTSRARAQTSSRVVRRLRTRRTSNNAKCNA
jgi:hypothetical protein